MNVHGCRARGGLGDTYYPELGNSGYDARHYDVKLKVDPATNQVEGHSTMEARATEALDSFHLDFSSCQVQGVRVNGVTAGFRREKSELVVLPGSPIAAGADFKVEIAYAGKPEARPSVAGDFLVGWKNNGQGVVVDSQPDGGQTWFPVNDHPLDKATYDYTVDVPKPYLVAANGTLLQVEEHGDRQTFHWKTRDPLASYLATVNIGHYVEERSEGPNGLPIRNYFPPEMQEKCHFDFARTGEMIELFSKLFGPYPFENYGVIVVNDPKAVAGAMEMQTLSLFEPAMVTGDRGNEDVVAHELAHHWFGNSVSLSRWQDLWLNEGFATYCEWLWLEHTQGQAALEAQAEKTRSYLEGKPGISIGEPPKADLFNGQVYMKGGLALHELRKTVGDAAFFQGVRSYVAQHSGGDFARNATVADFKGELEKAAGKPLDDFFRAWVDSPELPPRGPDRPSGGCFLMS